MLNNEYRIKNNEVNFNNFDIHHFIWVNDIDLFEIKDLDKPRKICTN